MSSASSSPPRSPCTGRGAADDGRPDPTPEDPYGIAKFAVELELMVTHEMFGLRTSSSARTTSTASGRTSATATATSSASS